MKEKILLIGMVWTQQNNGSAIHFNHLRHYLAQIFEVTTISLGKGDETTGHIYLQSPNNALIRQLYWNIYLPYKIIKVCKQKGIQLVYFRTTGTVVAPLWAMRLTGAKTAVEINGILSHKHSESRPLLYRAVTGMYKWLFANIGFFAASQGYARYLMQEFAIPPEKVLSLHLGYDDTVVFEDKMASHSERDLDPAFRYLLFIGKIELYQGLQYIVEAMGQNKEKIVGWKLLVVGDGPHKKNLLDIIERYQISNHVVFHDRVPKETLRYYLSLGAVGLSTFSPDRGKPGYISGLKTYDYMFYQNPIITSIMDDMAEYIAEKNIGWVVKTFQAQEIFSIIEAAMEPENYSQKKQAYQNIYSEITQEFQWDRRFGKISERIRRSIAKH